MSDYQPLLSVVIPVYNEERTIDALLERVTSGFFIYPQQEVIVVPELQETDGLALLARYVPQLVQHDPQDARALVRAVGSLPLALTLMGKYLAAQTFTGQPRRLQAALTQLHDTEQRLHVSMPTALRERSPSLPADIPLVPQPASSAPRCEYGQLRARSTGATDRIGRLRFDGLLDSRGGRSCRATQTDQPIPVDVRQRGPGRCCLWAFPGRGRV